MLKKSKNRADIEILDGLPVLVDTLLLKDGFAHYKHPRKKIFDMAKHGYLYLIRRGCYLNMKSHDFKQCELEPLANALYYPSYVSCEWALQYYGLMMERVQTVTSVTLRNSRVFKTPLGHFSFEHLNRNRYQPGYVLNTSGEKSFFMARPEKALLDYVNLRLKHIHWRTKKDIELFLIQDLRMDLKEFFRLVKINELQELLIYYHRNSKEARLIKWLIHSYH